MQAPAQVTPKEPLKEDVSDFSKYYSQKPTSPSKWSIVSFLFVLVLLPALFIAANNRTQDQSQASLPATYSPKILLLIYNPTVSDGQKLVTYKGWNDPLALTQQIINTIALTSSGKVNYTIVETVELDTIPTKADGWTYTIEQYLTCSSSGGSNCHSPDLANYVEMINAVDACSKRNSGEIDELWIWGGPWFGFWESNLAGPGAFWYNSGPTQGASCEQLLPIMGFNYEVDYDLALHSYAHRVESTMAHVYGSWSPQETHAWNKFSLLDKDVPGRAGCGNTHFPPNGANDYDYGNQTVVSSMCEDWLNYPNLTGAQESFNCDRWQCSQLGYLSWWYRHLPSADGTNPDGKLNNWWHYIVDPQNTIVAPASPEPSDSGIVTFSNLSATLGAGTAMFHFDHTGTPGNFRIDISTLPDMSWDVYLDFGFQMTSPIIVSDPQAKWDKYVCGTTLYWRVLNESRTAQSDIQTAQVCPPEPSPSPSPSPTPRASPKSTTNPGVRVGFPLASSNGSEDVAQQNISVTLSTQTNQEVSVTYQIAGGTATQGTDYVLTDGTLVFPPGTLSQTIPLTIQDDTSNESNESIFLQLLSPINAGLGKAKHVFTILDND